MAFTNSYRVFLKPTPERMATIYSTKTSVQNPLPYAAHPRKVRPITAPRRKALYNNNLSMNEHSQK